MDATSEQEEEEEGEEEGLVSNTINLHDVGERETKASFTCRAQNNNQTRPVSRTVRLRLNFPPGDVRIVGLGGESSLVAGKAQSILCVSVGSRPAATITWWKDGKEVPQLSLTEPLSCLQVSSRAGRLRCSTRKEPSPPPASTSSSPVRTTARVSSAGRRTR